MIVMNEKSYIENISSDEFKKKLRYNITLYIKLKKEQGLNKKQTCQKVLDFMDNNVDNFIEEKWIKFIDKTITKVYDNDETLNCIDSVWVTDKDLDIVASIEDRNVRLTLFTLIVLARFRNMMNENNNNWVSYPLKLIFKVSGMFLNQDVQDGTIKMLVDGGYIKLSKKIDNLNIRVECLCDGENELEIKDIKKLSRQYLDYLKILDGWKRCEVCGGVYKPNGNNSRYCNRCVKEKELEKKRIWWKNNKN